MSFKKIPLFFLLREKRPGHKSTAQSSSTEKERKKSEK